VNPIRKFIGKIFNFKKTEPAAVKLDDHFNVAAPKPSVVHVKKLKRVRMVRGGFGGLQPIRGIGGHRVRPLKRAQKRDFEKLWGVSVD
jgi:hypothetical protein